MAVTIADIQKLRKMTGAGLADCKKALTEAEGDIEKAIELVRQRGLAIAAKRSLVKVVEGFGAMIALKCETDFVANGKDFIALTQSILDAAVENRCKSIEEVKELALADGQKVADAVVQRSGITGEKMELDGYLFIEGDNIYAYNHQNKNLLCAMVQLNKAAEEQGHNLTLQVANTNPLGLDVDSIPESVKESELKVAIEKTKQEQVQKAVEAALKKAGFNLYIAENEEHLAEGIAKKEITEEQAQEIRDLKVRVAQGRLQKFFKDSCLVKQEYIWDTKMSVADYLKSADKELKVLDFKRFTLRAE